MVGGWGAMPHRQCRTAKRMRGSTTSALDDPPNCRLVSARHFHGFPSGRCSGWEITTQTSVCYSARGTELCTCRTHTPTPLLLPVGACACAFHPNVGSHSERKGRGRIRARRGWGVQTQRGCGHVPAPAPPCRAQIYLFAQSPPTSTALRTVSPRL